MDLQLRDQVIVVTGAAKGIGRAVAAALVAEGARPVIVGRNEEDNRRAAAEIGAAHFVTAELSETDECRRAIEQTLEMAGRIDGLVNNAGVNDGVSLARGTTDDFVRSLRRNLVHYFDMARFALPEIARRRGAIVNIGSKVAETGQGETSGYAAANGGRNALTREWAVELAPRGVRVNAVIVAECWTPMYEEWLASRPDPGAARAAIEHRIPLAGRMTNAAEIAAAVLFLLSPVSSHTTGQLLHVDGGYVHLDRAVAVK